MLFTKSEETLPDINLNLRFGEGVEYGGFAEVNPGDNPVFTPPFTDLDVISDVNPESPSFLISGVTRDSGSVYVCFGIRAECGADLINFPPQVEFLWDYTTASGVSCEGAYTLPNDFGGNVAVPRVQFTAPLPGNTNLGVVNSTACNTVTVTQTGVGASATGYLFTADDYGFSDGIEISEVRLEGVVLMEGTDYSIDPATGLLEANFDRSDAPLALNDTEEIDICYTYTACFPNVDFNPVYTVVAACDGELCTGPIDIVNTARLISNFPARGSLAVGFSEVQPPSVASDSPYIIEVSARATNTTPIEGDLTSLFFDIRSCANPIFSEPTVEVVSGGMVIGTLDESTVSIRATDSGANPAGTIRVDLRRNTTLSGGDLIDLDGDMAFDDIAAGGEITLRLTFDLACSAADAANSITVDAGESMVCQFTDIQVTGRRDCNARNVVRRLQNAGGSDFTASSTSSFSAPDLVGARNGFNFGAIGSFGNCNPRPASTETVAYRYNLGASPLTDCPATATPVGKAVITITGISSITDDFVFDNVGLDTDGDDLIDLPLTAADFSVTYPNPGVVQLAINGGNPAAMTGQDMGFIFDMTLDTSFCSPQQTLILSGVVGIDCLDPTIDCEPPSTANSTFVFVNPEDCDCDCYLSHSVEVTRLSRGFTDETRTTLVDPLMPGDADNLNVLAGDTIQIRTGFTIIPEAANSSRFDTELRNADRTVNFEVSMRRPGGSSFDDADRYPALFDYTSTRLQSLKIFRGNQVFDLGDLYSGGTNSLPQSGILVGGFSNRATTNDFPTEGEVFSPGFPNGGYTLSSGDDGTNDNRDGHRLAVSLRGDPSRNGEFNALEVLYDEIGEWMPEDSIELIWNTVLVVNPGQNPDPAMQLPISLVGLGGGSKFIDREQNILFGFNESVGCPGSFEVVEFHFPEVVNNLAEINYTDACEAELVLSFMNTDLPAGWYANEFRPVNGIEQIQVDFPFPYVYTGGATVEAAGVAPFPIDLELSSSVDTAIVGGNQAFAAMPTAGVLTFTDAEFLDSVRADGFANFDFGDNDITTVGGSFPLLGSGGGVSDELIFRIPLQRLCGDAPAAGLSATYNWANRYLPDYEDWPYRVNTSSSGTDYWVGKVRDNDGNVVTPAVGNNNNGTVNNNLEFYFPFQRLQDDPTDEVNPHRRIDLPAAYTVLNQPDALTATISGTVTGLLADGPGTELNTVTITPGAGQTLTGTVAISISSGGTLVSATDGTNTAVQAAITDSTTVFALNFPTTLAPDDPFVFDIETDLLRCEAVEICVIPVLGCSGPEAAELAFSFDATCGSSEYCYVYNAGAASVRTTIDQPQTLDLCVEQVYSVQYFNDGSSDLSNFAPVLFIPEGLDVRNFMFSTTGGASGTLTSPVYDSGTEAANMVFGQGRVFVQSEIDAAVNANGFPNFNPGQVLTITFIGATSCDFNSGLPLISVVRGDAACMLAAEGPEEFSTNIDVSLPDLPTTIIDFGGGNTPLEVSCSTDGGDPLVVTISNVGKGASSDTEICLRLPNGITFDPASVNAILPEDFTLSASDITVTNINAGGDQQYCFMAPDIVPGGFVCIEIPFIVGDVDCGPVFIGATLNTTETVTCQSTNEVCDIKVNTVASPYFEIVVVPAVTANEVQLSAACTGTPGIFDVNYSFDFVAESQDFDGVANLTLYSDVDGDGELNEAIDVELGNEMINIMADKDEPQAFSGTFSGINQRDICPLLLSVEALGCTCSEVVTAFPNILPDFLGDLGDGITLCPGETVTVDGVCPGAELNYTFDPPEAGTVVADPVSGDLTVSLNAGFGVESPIPLNISGAFGTCNLDAQLFVSQLADFDFGPYAFTVCSNQTQEVDLGIPQIVQEDISINITPTDGIEDPTSVEPRIVNLQEDTDYIVEFSLQDGTCVGETTLSVTVEQPVEITLQETTGCLTGFTLSDRVTLTPATATGAFQTGGDGEFTPGNTVPGKVTYIPGPMDREAGSVSIRFNSDEQEGPCGPSVARTTVTILLVDCGDFFWDGQSTTDPAGGGGGN